MNKKEMQSIQDFIRVVNVRGEETATADEIKVIIHRENPVLGNRHAMKSKDWRERDRVIEAYQKDLDEDLKNKGPMSGALDEVAAKINQGQKVALVCFCAPAPCHGDRLILPLIEKVKQLQINESLQKKEEQPGKPMKF